jgi:ribosomal protein L7/L12
MIKEADVRIVLFSIQRMETELYSMKLRLAFAIGGYAEVAKMSRIEAIKKYKFDHNCSLLEAKDAIDKMT